MKLLITSVYHKVDTNQHSLFILDPATKRVVQTIPYSAQLDARPTDGRPQPSELEFLPYGMASDEDKIYITCNYNIGAFDKNTLEFIELVSTSGTPHTHELKYADGFLYRANTTNDTITRTNVSTKEEIHFSFKTMGRVSELEYPTNQKMDVAHINCITIDGDNVYVLAHNRYQKRAEVFVMDKDLTSATKLANLDYACHDMVIHNGKLYSFGSQRGILVILDLTTLRSTKRYIIDAEKFFLRGGIILDGKIVVVANSKASQTFEAFENPLSRPNAHFLTIDPETYSITWEETPDFATIADLEILP